MYIFLASLVNEFWKRKQAEFKYRWDLANFEEIEVIWH